MADSQPAPTPAPDGKTPQGTPPAPEQKPADVKPDGTQQTPPAPTSIIDSLSDEEKNYLKGQGIEDLNSPEAIKKIINHGRSSQQTAAELKTKLDKVKEGIVDPQPTPANPLLPTGQPGQPQPSPDTSESKGIDQTTAFTLATSLTSNFPEIKDDIVSGKFYKDMEQYGIPATINGQVNLTGILQYGKLAQTQAQLDSKMADLNKPGEGAIPDAKPAAPAQPAADAPMTMEMARAIAFHVSRGESHERADEATKFIQDNLGKK